MTSGGIASIELIDGGFFMLAATVVCCYDHAITFGEEVNCVWKRRISGASILFFLNRYAMLVASLVGIVQILPWSKIPDFEPNDKDNYISGGVCILPIRFVDVFLIVSNTAYVVFAALRMFALHRMSKYVLGVVLGIGLLNPCIQILLMSVGNIFRLTKQGRIGVNYPWGRINCLHSAGPSSPGIFGSHSGDQDVEYFLAGLRVHALIFEMMLIGLTWRKTVWSVKRSAVHTPFTTMMITNGTLYFLVVALSSLLNAIGMIVSLAQFSRPWNRIASFIRALNEMGSIVDTMTSICMSRFILDLLALTMDGQDSQLCSSQGNIRFATVVETTVADVGADLSYNFQKCAEDDRRSARPASSASGGPAEVENEHVGRRETEVDDMAIIEVTVQV